MEQNRPKVTIKCKLDNSIIERIKENFELVEELLDAEVLIIRTELKVNRQLLENNPRLRLIISATHGMDHVDVKACEEINVKVAFVPSKTESVTEYVFGTLLEAHRKLRDVATTMKQGTWVKPKYVSSELHGKTMGIIGLGNIGKKVALVAVSFGMNVIFYDPYVENTDYKNAASIEELFRNSDVITFHCPLNEETRGMVGMEQLESLKENSIIINSARAGIIPEKTLCEFLKNRKDVLAIVDVFEKEPVVVCTELTALENVMATPHIAGQTVESIRRTTEQVLWHLNDSFGMNKTRI